MTEHGAPKALIRFVNRRLTSWSEERTDSEVRDLEFRDRNGEPDLRPSVYEINLSDLVRACAEHGTVRYPPDTTAGIDVGGLARAVHESAGNTGFKFADEAHREMLLRDGDDLLAFIHEIRKDLTVRMHKIKKDEIRSYAKSRLAAEDPEWLAVVAKASARGIDSWVVRL